MRVNEELSIESKIPLQEVYNLHMHWEINKHASLVIFGGLKGDCRPSDWTCSYPDSEIKLYLSQMDDILGTEKLWYNGKVKSVKLQKYHGIGAAIIKATSASAILDERDSNICLAFQNPNQTYFEVVKQIVEPKSGNVICSVEHKRIERPLICYMETKWEFLKRIASHQATYLIPDIVTGKPNLWFGIRKGDKIKNDLIMNHVRVEIKKSYLKSEKPKGVKSYIWESRFSYSIGDWTSIDGEKYIIYAVDALLRKGLILYTYRLATIADIQTAIYFNESFTGMSIWGKVEEVKNEMVRISLDSNSEEGQYFYPWRPETGNALFAVPEVGAKAAVYFMNHDEREGISVRCKGTVMQKAKPEEKLLRTPDDCTIESTELFLKIQKNYEIIRLADSNGINFSGSKVEVNATGKIRLKAKRIFLSAAQGIKATTE